MPALTQRIRLEDGGNGTLDDPREVLKEALCKLALRQCTLEHELMSIAVVELDESFDTMAVALYGDGVVRLKANPDFTVKLGPDGSAFVMAHEAYHLLYGHLYAGEALNLDEDFKLACEVIVNNRVQKRLETSSLPLVDGKPSGVDPDKVYQKYREAVRDKGATPVSKDQFLSSDLACRSYIAEIPKPPKPRQDFCSHPKTGDGGGDGQGQPGQDPSIDPGAAGTVVDRTLDSLMQRALNGDQGAKDSLLGLGDQLGEDHPLWGTLGLGALRGEAVPSAQVKFWEYFLTQDLASILEPGCQLVYPKRLAGLSDIYAEQDAEIPFMPLGKEPKVHAAVYNDMSGSVSGDLAERVMKLYTDSVPGGELEMYTFDTQVYDIEDGTYRGGGGTDFQCIIDHVEALEEEPDVVIILTDGYAPEVCPPWSDKIIWLITPGGKAWPMDRGMRCIEVDI
jgi:hypothetical protein